MNLPPNSYRKGRSDQSGVHRGGGPDGRTITGWTDVSGKYHLGMPDASLMGADGLAQLEDGDTIKNGHTILQKEGGEYKAVGVFQRAQVAPGPDDDTPPGLWDNIMVGAVFAGIVAFLIAVALASKPAPVTDNPIPDNYVPRDGTPVWYFGDQPPPPTAEDRQKVGLP